MFVDCGVETVIVDLFPGEATLSQLSTSLVCFESLHKGAGGSKPSGGSQFWLEGDSLHFFVLPFLLELFILDLPASLECFPSLVNCPKHFICFLLSVLLLINGLLFGW